MKELTDSLALEDISELREILKETYLSRLPLFAWKQYLDLMGLEYDKKHRCWIVTKGVQQIGSNLENEYKKPKTSKVYVTPWREIIQNTHNVLKKTLHEEIRAWCSKEGINPTNFYEHIESLAENYEYELKFILEGHLELLYGDKVFMAEHHFDASPSKMIAMYDAISGINHFRPDRSHNTIDFKLLRSTGQDISAYVIA